MPGTGKSKSPNARQREIAARLQTAANRSLRKAKEREDRGFVKFTRADREGEISARRAGAPSVTRAIRNRQ